MSLAGTAVSRPRRSTPRRPLWTQLHKSGLQALRARRGLAIDFGRLVDRASGDRITRFPAGQPRFESTIHGPAAVVPFEPWNYRVPKFRSEIHVASAGMNPPGTTPEPWSCFLALEITSDGANVLFDTVFFSHGFQFQGDWAFYRRVNSNTLRFLYVKDLGTRVFDFPNAWPGFGYHTIGLTLTPPVGLGNATNVRLFVDGNDLGTPAPAGGDPEPYGQIAAPTSVHVGGHSVHPFGISSNVVGRYIAFAIWRRRIPSQDTFRRLHADPLLALGKLRDLPAVPFAPPPEPPVPGCASGSPTLARVASGLPSLEVPASGSPRLRATASGKPAICGPK